MSNNNDGNIWRTIVLVAVAMILGVFAWQFLTRSSSDLQALFVGIFVFGIPAGIVIGLLLHPRPRGAVEAYNDGYERGYAVGEHANRPVFGPCDMAMEVIVPTQQRELVRR